MTTSPSVPTAAEQALRNQNVLMLVIGVTAARAVARNRLVIVIGLIVAARVVHRYGTATSAAVRRRAAANVSAWRHG